MLPSSTVENYLKVIFQQQLTLSPPQLVPMGQVAAAMGVTPGTATTMVKTLADSGLLQYEPYSGVRLTAAGERLAGLVVRRHRIIEQFLVEVMGMSWDEVHDEAEKLEHVVSERLIERMDEMLGRPQVDPHGDPIPSPDGSLKHRELHSLLTCPMHTPVTVTRVADQDAAFLRFLENSSLKPGQEVEVEERDAAADSVRVRSAGNPPVTIGARAASKLLVDVISVVLLVLAAAGSLSGQTPPTTPPAEPFAITDNSFLVEEAFNQEPRVFQNIFNGVHDGDGAWAMQVTQEWPAPSMTHQLSYSVGIVSGSGETGPGDVMLNYRYQWLQEGRGRPAVSPRASLIVPVADERRGLGHGGWGWQFNLPVSKQVGDFYLHGNAGLTWFPSAPTDHLPSVGFAPAEHVSLASPFLGGSAIYRLRPMLNLMFETVVDWREEGIAAGLTRRETVAIFSPGVRHGWNFGDRQLVLGVALPVTRAAGDSSVGLFGYASYELPF